MTSTDNQIYPVVWQGDRAVLIDQTQLPNSFAVVGINRSEDMAEAIRTMIVRGAPAIGVAAAYGMYLGAREIDTSDRETFLKQLEKVAQLLRQTRPTAVNLFWAISRMLKTAYETLGSVAEIKAILLDTAKSIQLEDLQTCQAIGDHGLSVLPPEPAQLTLLTHCNAGSLATAGYGTALGVIRSAWREKRLLRVYADETRPRLQGAKLTAWECVEEEIPVTVIADGMAAHCMNRGMIDGVVVGADRIAANGETEQGEKQNRGVPPVGGGNRNRGGPPSGGGNRGGGLSAYVTILFRKSCFFINLACIFAQDMIIMIKQPTTNNQQPQVDRLRSLAHLLDDAIPIPGTNYRVGIDPILGLFPAIGDYLGMILSAYIVFQAFRMGVPKETLLRMGVNVAIDTLVGIVPILGDLFDAGWKANQKNVALVESNLDSPESRQKSDLGFILLLLGALVLAIVVITVVPLIIIALFLQAIN